MKEFDNRRYCVGGLLHGTLQATDHHDRLSVAVKLPEDVREVYSRGGPAFDPRMWVAQYEPDSAIIDGPGFRFEMLFLRWGGMEKQEAAACAVGLVLGNALHHQHHQGVSP